MFLKYFEFIFAPFRAVNNRILGIRNIKGNIQVDINRARSLKARGANAMERANQFNQRVNQMGQPQQQQQGGQMPPQQGQPPGMPQMPQVPGMPGMPGMGGAPQGPNPNPPIIKRGFWIFAKKFCSQCEQQLDKSWDQCPYCAQIAQQVVAAPAKLQAAKTQAFVMDAQGGPGSMQLLGWIVPLQGAQRGELFTLSPTTHDRHRSQVHDRAERQVHVVQARRDQGREWRVGAARFRLDQRHLRQQPSRRSP